MCANLEIYNKARSVPNEAKKAIAAGRLKGYTDINPMWRIKKLTELFGVCGIGWYSEITRTWLEKGANETVANVEIKLYIKVDGEWSKGISGIGASKFICQESKGTYDNDESYKCAFTDALSVACKQLGIGADVYFEKDTDKYSYFTDENKAQNQGEKKQGKQVKAESANAPKTSQNAPQNATTITYEDALNHIVEVTSLAGMTLREVYKTDRAHVKVIYEQGSAKTRQAIDVIQAEIKKAKENKQ
jgi:hypothetical protein